MTDEGGGASRTTDPATGSSAATDVSLREFFAVQLDALRRETAERVARFETLIDANRREIQVIQDAAHEAITKAETANERRFESVNEFRAQLSDQTASFMPREVYDAAHQQLIDRVASLEREARFGEGREKGIGATRVEGHAIRAEGHARIGTGTAVAGTVLGLLFLLFTYLNYQANTRKPAVTTPTVTVTTRTP